jgi:hypothetical protein
MGVTTRAKSGLALMAALVCVALAGCTAVGTGRQTTGGDLTLQIVDVQMGGQAVANQPLAFTGTVRFTDAGHAFVGFHRVAAPNPHTIRAAGRVSTSISLPTVRTETHTGTTTFAAPGTYVVDFVNSEPPIQRTVVVN